jgi:hypothetical protein
LATKRALVVGGLWFFLPAQPERPCTRDPAGRTRRVDAVGVRMTAIFQAVPGSARDVRDLDEGAGDPGDLASTTSISRGLAPGR